MIPRETNWKYINMTIPIPIKLALFGADEAERERSRTDGEIRLAFESVEPDLIFELKVNDKTITDFKSGDWVKGLPSQSIIAFSIRATNGTIYSPWSNIFRTITRPKAPTSVTRMDVDQIKMAISFYWKVLKNDGHNLVFARIDDKKRLVFLANPAALEETFHDISYPTGEKKYFLRWEMPTASIPSDVLDGPNISDWSTPVTAYSSLYEITSTETQEFLSTRINAQEEALALWFKRSGMS